MAKAFASQGDLAEKKISFSEIGRDLWAFTAEGDPNTGVIIGDDSVMIVDAQATPRLAQKLSRKFAPSPTSQLNMLCCRIIMQCVCLVLRLMAHQKSSPQKNVAPWWQSVARKIGIQNLVASHDFSKAMKASPASPGPRLHFNPR